MFAALHPIHLFLLEWWRWHGNIAPDIFSILTIHRPHLTTHAEPRRTQPHVLLPELGDTSQEGRERRAGRVGWGGRGGKGGPGGQGGAGGRGEQGGTGCAGGGGGSASWGGTGCCGGHGGKGGPNMKGGRGGTGGTWFQWETMAPPVMGSGVGGCRGFRLVDPGLALAE